MLLCLQAASDAMEEARARLHELQTKQEESLKDLQEIMQLLEGLTGDAAQVCLSSQSMSSQSTSKKKVTGNQSLCLSVFVSSSC